MELYNVTKWKKFFKLCNGDASHSPKSLFLLFLSHILYLFFVLFTCAITPPSLCLSQPWVPRWQPPPAILLMMTSRNEQRKPRTYCLLLKHDARDTRRKMKIKPKWSLEVMWRNCPAFIATPLTLIMASCRNWHCIKWIEWRIKYFLSQWMCLFTSKQEIRLMILT